MSDAPWSAAAFWSDDEVVTRYRESARSDEARCWIEEPEILDYLGDVSDCEILELGCGDGAMGKWLLERGAIRYVGVDVSPAMAERARRLLAVSNAAVHCENLETWLAGGAGIFDIAISRLVLHYVRDIDRVLEIVRHHLRPGGRFIFSVEHPIYTSTYSGDRDDYGVARRWQVAGYFREGARSDVWLGRRVVKYHRAVATWFRAICNHGLHLARFSEGAPVREHFSGQQRYEAHLDVPICMMFLCVREGND